uniref:Uncharacterized protein n=1 Tax=Zea mays TaxID=4577 RepID=C4XVE0_MAIZE|nr:unknown [Zea mays]
MATGTGSQQRRRTCARDRGKSPLASSPLCCVHLSPSLLGSTSKLLVYCSKERVQLLLTGRSDDFRLLLTVECGPIRDSSVENLR